MAAELREPIVRARTALQELHGELVQSSAREHEREHGPLAGPGQLLHLVAHDPGFAWLHPLSELVVALDDLLDSATIAAADAAAVRVEIEEILDRGPAGFRERYVATLQRTPEVAASHAQVRRALAALPASAPEDVAELLHARHKWAVVRRERRGPGA